MSYMKALKCRECGKEYPKEALHVCELCSGPLEVTYEYEKIKDVLTREVVEKRAPNMVAGEAEFLAPLGDPERDGHVVQFFIYVAVKQRIAC